jgi:hypothetical protein
MHLYVKVGECWTQYTQQRRIIMHAAVQKKNGSHEYTGADNSAEARAAGMKAVDTPSEKQEALIRKS